MVGHQRGILRLGLKIGSEIWAPKVGPIVSFKVGLKKWVPILSQTIGLAPKDGSYWVGFKGWDPKLGPCSIIVSTLCLFFAASDS